MSCYHTLRDSIYNPAFYRNIKGAPVGKAIRCFSLLVLCVSLPVTTSLYASFGSWSTVVTDARVFKQKVIDYYPDELEITIQNGKATSNVSEPYRIPLPADFTGKETPGSAHTPKNLIVINTGHTINQDDFKTYDTYAVLGSDSYGVNDESSGKVEIRKIGQSSEAFILDKTKAREVVDIIAHYLKVIGLIFLTILPVIIFGFMWIGLLIYLVFGAGIVWLIGKIRGVPLRYGESYILGLYLLTIPLFYQLLTELFPIFFIPYAFTLILAIMATLNLVPDTLASETTQTIAETGTTKTPDGNAPKSSASEKE